LRVDITDPKLVKAYAHPIRLRILGLLDNRVASPSEIAAEIGVPLPNTAYHVRQLANLGLVELVSRKVKGGAIEHHYTTKARPTVPDEAWDELPEVVRRGYAGETLRQAVAQMTAAAERDGFAGGDAHLSRTPARLDRRGRAAVLRELRKAHERIERIVEESEARIAAAGSDGGEPPAFVDAAVVLAFFETGSGGGPGPGGGPGAGPDGKPKRATRRGAGTRSRAARGSARRRAS
jgi:DNA-binding transcriptional ArsR family regulator